MAAPPTILVCAFALGAIAITATAKAAIINFFILNSFLIGEGLLKSFRRLTFRGYFTGIIFVYLEEDTTQTNGRFLNLYFFVSGRGRTYFGLGD
jgi:hypothetical protein